ncbi:MAG: phasin family protein [Gammaproteobacteria bacterium]|nr:MAG: phasin family protein [Gammaproteobacteria bacterium]
MTNEILDIFDKGRKAFEPFGKLGEVGMEAAEKIFKVEADIASDFIDLTVDQLRAFGTAEDVGGYTREQGRLATEYTGRAQERTVELMEAFTGVQKAFVSVAKTGYEEALAAVGKAAPAKAKATRKKAA